MQQALRQSRSGLVQRKERRVVIPRLATLLLLVVAGDPLAVRAGQPPVVTAALGQTAVEPVMFARQVARLCLVVLRVATALLDLAVVAVVPLPSEETEGLTPEETVGLVRQTVTPGAR